MSCAAIVKNKSRCNNPCERFGYCLNHQTYIRTTVHICFELRFHYFIDNVIQQHDNYDMFFCISIKSILTYRSKDVFVDAFRWFYMNKTFLSTLGNQSTIEVWENRELCSENIMEFLETMKQMLVNSMYSLFVHKSMYSDNVICFTQIIHFIECVQQYLFIVFLYNLERSSYMICMSMAGFCRQLCKRRTKIISVYQEFRRFRVISQLLLSNYLMIPSIVQYHLRPYLTFQEKTPLKE